MRDSREMFSFYPEDSAEKDENIRNTLEEQFLLLNTVYSHYFHYNGFFYDRRFSDEWVISAFQKELDFLNFVYDDGNYGKMWCTVMYNYGHLGVRYAKLGENEKAIEMNIVNDRVPEMKTTATVDGEKTVCATEEFTLTDIVEYQHLIPNKEYKVKGVLMDKSTGKPLVINGQTINSEATFVPEAPCGVVSLDFKFDSRYIKANTDIVVFENLYKDGKELAVHADINDKGQTVTIKVPEIKTSAKADGKSEVKAGKKITIIDTVTYKNLTVGKEYVIRGVLMDKKTGSFFMVNDKEISAEVKFTPKKSDGTVELTFTFDGSVITAETEVVVFERLYRDEVEIATHTDINDKGQTVKITVPEKPNTPSKTHTPKTGDESNKRTLATILGASLFGILCLAYTLLRKRKNSVKEDNDNEC